MVKKRFSDTLSFSESALIRKRQIAGDIPLRSPVMHTDFEGKPPIRRSPVISGASKKREAVKR